MKQSLIPLFCATCILGIFAFGAAAAVDQGTGQVVGRVLDGNKRPVAEAEVLAYSGTVFERKVKTDAEGKYTIADLPPGKYHLKARMGKRFTRRLPEYDIEAEPGSELAVDLELVEGGTIEVTLIDKKTRKPVVGGQVWFDCDDPAKRSTGKDGKVTISGFDYDEVGYEVAADGYAKRRWRHYYEVRTAPGEASKVTVELTPELAITGIVSDEKSQPVSDVVVTIESRRQGRWGSGRIEWEPDITGKDGQFRLGGLDGGEYTYNLKATKEGFAPGRARVSWKQLVGAKIVLRPGASLEGIVKNEKGAAVEGATVMLGKDVQTLSGADGRWKIERVEAESCTLVAEKGDLGSGAKKLNIGWKDQLTDIELILRKKPKAVFDVKGTIVDAIEGKPIPNVRLRFWQVGHVPFHKADEQGRFHFKDIPVGKREMYFKNIPSPNMDPADRVSFTIKDRDVDDLVIRLPRGATVAGKVLLPSGEPAWEAKIKMLHPEHGRGSRGGRLKITTDSGGRFVVRNILYGMGYRVRAELAGHPPAVSDTFNLRQGQKIEGITIRLKAQGKVAGSIQDGAGRPLSKNYWLTANLSGVDDGGWNTSWITGRVNPDEAGRFEIAGLPGGDVVLTLHHDGRGLDGTPGWTGTAARKTVRIVADQETTGADFVVGSAEEAKPAELDGFISGRVVSIADDEGVPGIDVYAMWDGLGRANGGHGKTKTGADGSFRIDGLLDGVFGLNVNYNRRAGYDAQELEKIPSNSEDIPVVLRRLCVVEGRIIERKTGKPVKVFSVFDVGSKERNVVDSEGRFRLEGLQRGSCPLRAVAEGVGVAQKTVELQEGETLRDVVLVLHEPWRISGRVVRKKNGTPIVGATATAMSLERSGKGSAVTDQDGRFSIPGVYPGKDTVFIEHPDFGRPWFEGTEIKQAPTDEISTFQLEEPGRVEGRVFFEGGMPYQGVTVLIQEGVLGYSRLFRQEAGTGYEGDFAFPAIPPGKYQAIWRMRDPEIGRGGHYGQAIEVVSGKTTKVSLGTGAGVISGVVTMDGKPKKYMVITFKAEGLERWIQTDDLGNYRVYGLEAGTYHLTLNEPGQGDDTLVERNIEFPKQGEVRMDFGL